MEQPEGPARIEERGDEENAERNPDPGLVDIPGDCVLVSAGELDLNLLITPRFDHGAGAVIDHGLGHVDAVLDVVDLPAVGAPGRRLRLHRRALCPLVGDGSRSSGDIDRLGASELEPRGRDIEVVNPLQRSERFIAERRLMGGVLGCRGHGREGEGGEQREDQSTGGREGATRSHGGHNEVMARANLAPLRIWALAALLGGLLLLGGCGGDSDQSSATSTTAADPGLTVAVTPADAAPGSTVRAAVVNDTDKQFTYGAGYELERQVDDGFEKVDLPDSPVIQIGYIAPAGGTGPPVRVKLPKDLQPGTYRVVIQRDVPNVGDLGGTFTIIG